jgi:hypothetical protein
MGQSRDEFCCSGPLGKHKLRAGLCTARTPGTQSWGWEVRHRFAEAVRGKIPWLWVPGRSWVAPASS